MNTPLSALTKSRAPKELCGYSGMPDAEYNRRWFARFHARTIVNERGCWVWQGPVNMKGYPTHPHRYYANQAHRAAYLLTHGVTLTSEQFVCHTCDERRCWNPAHLFIGDAAANNRDCGNKGRHHNSVKTHCKRGHEYTPENTYLKVTPTTVMRACLECQKLYHSKPGYIAWRREYQRQRRAAKRAQKSEQRV